MTFVFLHVGPQVLYPTLLVRSIRRLKPDAEIIQCADAGTPEIEGVTRVFRYGDNSDDLIMFRLRCYLALGLEEPAAYIDGDMLLIRPFNVAGILGECDVAVCERSFLADTPFNSEFRDMDLSEYDDKTVGEVYPYLGCFIATRDHAFWADCYDVMKNLPPKFHRWFGDQEAIRTVAERGDHSVKLLPESMFACLPEFVDTSVEFPCLVHFKGSRRKQLQVQWAEHLELDVT